VHLDAATGNVLADIRFADYSPMGVRALRLIFD
jgi:uncharacterized iron-regulated membrane protein